MNNETIRNYYDAFDRMKSFGAKYASSFAQNSRVTGLFTELSPLTTAMENQGVKKLTGSADYHGGTNSKQLATEQLREDLRAIRDTAQAIAEAEGKPEFDDQFILPRSNAYALLLTAAKSFLQEATPHKALFVEFELPEDFLEDLEADIDLLERSDDVQSAGFSEQVAGTAELSALALKGNQLRTQLVPAVRNKFRGEPGILAEWVSAIHIVRPQRKPKEPAKVPA